MRTASPATAAAEDVEDVEAAEHVATTGDVGICEEIGGGVGAEGVVDVVAIVGVEDVVTGEDNKGVEGVVGVEGIPVDEVVDAAGAVEHALAEEARGPKVVPATALVVWVPLADPPD